MMPSYSFTLKPMAMSLFFLIFLLINGFSSSFPASASKTTRFELIHRHSAPELPTPKTQAERVKELIHLDTHRVHMISTRISAKKKKRRRNLESAAAAAAAAAAAIPLGSGAFTGTGQYFVRFRVGTPSQKFLLVADTGSDLTWMNCRYNCHNNCSERIQNRRVFHSYRSASFQVIPCSTEMCQILPFSLVQCSMPMAPCLYDYRYADGSTAQGVFANETVTVGLENGRIMRLHQVVIGCSSAVAGPSFRAADGVLGLGYSDNSIVSKAKEKFGGKFSYCLVDHLSPKNVSSYLTFGHTNVSENMQYTELVLNVLNGFYPVNVAGISIGGVMLNIPTAVWDVNGQGGVIVDSGTSLTFLAEPAYIEVMNALKVALMRVTEEVEMKPFEFCLSSVGFDESVVPRLVIHFADSAQFQPPVKSYVIDVSSGVKCLGFMLNSWPDVSIIGNIMQQNFAWEFDTVNKRLGFAPSTCV